jgi:hypothetical protein
MRSFIICDLHHILLGHQIKEDEIGGTCSTHERDLEMRSVLWLENLNGRDHSKDLGVDGMIILERVLGKNGG